MERFIADLVRNFESGRINRRQFCEAVTLAAGVYAIGDAAKAQTSRGLKMLGINHVSYSCADYTKVRDFYVNHLGMQSVPDKDNGSRANLMFGPEPGKGGQFLVARNARAPANPRPPATGFIDHVCYTISNWDDKRVDEGLKESGRPFVARPGNVNVLDPFNYPVQLANSEEENPWK